MDQDTGNTVVDLAAARAVRAIPPATYFAAFDGKSIWGVGKTAEQARAEAEGYLTDQFADKRDTVLTATLTSLKVAPIADELVNDMHVFGAGFTYFTLRDGVLVPDDEPFECEDQQDEDDAIDG